MRIQVFTCNSIFKNNKYSHGFHEIHEIDNLLSSDHVIATVSSIITNHIQFKDDNSRLDMVIVSGDNADLLLLVIDYFKINSFGVEIVSAETAL